MRVKTNYLTSISDQKGAHHWPSVLIDLNNRGVKDILIACVDGLKGFPEAIESIYPNTEIQHCVIHQIRNSMKYVASKNQKAFMADLKCIYKAATLNAAELALDELETKWGDKYPMVIKSWRNKWPTLSAYFKYPDYVRTAIYTTNAVEAVHRQFRKLTKTKCGAANENSLLKRTLRRYVEGIKALDASSTKLEPYTVAIGDSF